MSKPAKQLESAPRLYTEKYRPHLHFSAAENWLNDPNGLVWHDGVFHLYYQYNPTGNDWGNMHWGHAVSTNLVEWEHRPVALKAEPWGVGYMFSGCAVIDHDNRSGLGQGGKPPMIAIYTSCNVAGIQAQSIAVSHDNGESFSQYPGNPVIENPGTRDFRDPKVIWHEESAHWVLALAADDHIELYRSENLIDWQRTSRLMKPYGSHKGVWECPDLFPMRTRDGEQKWVLTVSVSTEHSERDEQVQYFVGEFDGTTFTPQSEEEMWLDYGADNYGAVTWDGVPAEDGRRIMIGWMSSWRYAREMPTYPWRGNMTIPRELRLFRTSRGFELSNLPVQEFASLRTAPRQVARSAVTSDAVQQLFDALAPELLDLELSFSWPKGESRSFGLRFTNANGEKAAIAYYTGTDTLIVDRTQVGIEIPNPRLAERFEAPVRDIEGSIDLRIIKDTASVEVFANDGRTVISANLFYDEPFDKVTIFGADDVNVEGEVSVPRSIWQDK